MTRVINGASDESALFMTAIDIGTSTILVSWGSSTHTGNVRTLNEDAALVAPPVFVVADGMGGHDGGEIASALAIESMKSLRSAATIDRTAIVDTVAQANHVIHQQSGGGERSMGTTITGVVVAGSPNAAAVSVLNVGDSRTYRLRGGQLEQMTTDHSHVQELIDAGLLDPAGAAAHPQRNVVTRALGIEPSVEVDVVLVPVLVGDRFLICSDGLCGQLDSLTMAACLAISGPQTAADALVRTTLGGEARDNVTVIVLDIDGIAFAEDVDRTDRRGTSMASGDDRADITDRRFSDDTVETSRSPAIAAAMPGMIFEVPTSREPDTEVVEAPPPSLIESVPPPTQSPRRTEQIDVNTPMATAVDHGRGEV
jgi:serine/threonine protein phosphatase PrpC